MIAARILRCRYSQHVFRRGYLSENFQQSLAKQLNNTFSKDSSFNDILEMKKMGNYHVVPELTSQIVIKNYINSGRHSELLLILKDKLECRIFLDDYTGGCFLDHFLKSKEDLKHAVEVVVAHQEEFKNNLVVALALKLIFNYLKNTNVAEDLMEIKDSNSKPEKKERVGFLRNNALITLEPLNKEAIGKTMINLIHNNNINTHIRANMHLIGLCLCEQYNDAQNLLKVNQNAIHKDVVDLCISFDKKSTISPLGDYWEPLKAFDELFDVFIKDISAKNEELLMDLQASNYSKWFEESKRNEENAKTAITSSTVVNAENIVKDIENEKKLLWYFDNKDSIDLKLFQQKKVYPKKWFGKKKKPKTIDDKYVPPEVIKRIQ